MLLSWSEQGQFNISSMWYNIITVSALLVTVRRHGIFIDVDALGEYL